MLAIDDLRRMRAAGRIGHTIHYFESADSTNDVAQRMAAAGAAEGTAVIAEMQTQGRGRLGRAWASPPFCNVYLSIVLRPPIAASDAPRLTLVAGLAVADAVRRWAPAAIKWPNDVVIDGRKVAGILTEMEADGDRVRCAIVGIGVNLNVAPDEFPPDLRGKVTGLRAVTGAPIDRVAFTAELMAQVEERYDLFLRAGFAALRPAWEACSFLSGRYVEIDDNGRRCAGVVRGIADDGALLLRDRAGRETRVVAGDVTVLGGYDAAAGDERDASRD